MPKEREVLTHFSNRVGSPVKLHLHANKSQERVTGILSGHNLHRLGSSFKFLIQALDDIRGSQRYPFILGKSEESRQVSMDLPRHLVAEGNSFSHFARNDSWSSRAFTLDEA